MISFTQGALQRVEMYSQNLVGEIETQYAVTIPENTHIIFVNCSNLVVPDTELFKLSEVLETLNSKCQSQMAIVCALYEYHKDSYYMSCRSLTKVPFENYYFSPEEEPRTISLEEIDGITVKLNT